MVVVKWIGGRLYFISYCRREYSLLWGGRGEKNNDVELMQVQDVLFFLEILYLFNVHTYDMGTL